MLGQQLAGQACTLGRVRDRGDLFGRLGDGVPLLKRCSEPRGPDEARVRPKCTGGLDTAAKPRTLCRRLVPLYRSEALSPPTLSVVAAEVDVALVALKPLRLNFALVCIWCGERGCESERCITLHARSRWVVCEECHGYGFAPDCDCTFGVVETVSENTIRAQQRVLGERVEQGSERRARHCA